MVIKSGFWILDCLPRVSEAELIKKVHHDAIDGHVELTDLIVTHIGTYLCRTMKLSCVGVQAGTDWTEEQQYVEEREDCSALSTVAVMMDRYIHKSLKLVYRGEYWASFLFLEQK
jgi:hypothetical protein